MTGNPVGLVEFLQQRMVDQIALLRQVQAQAVTDRVDPADPRFPALSLARIVEADIAAKRRIIERCQEIEADRSSCPSVLNLADDALTLLAAPFSSHPDWQPEWSVE